MVNLEGTLRSSLAGRYEIEDEIGRGGMSVVFRALDLKHHRTVAIKVLRPEPSQQIGAERFHREIEFVAGLNHPHILPLHDSGEADGLLFYVVPFVEGGSLRARIEADGALPEADALRITREIADALGYAHERDVIHRDVKPGNILLSGDHALLADFGVAHLASGVQETLTEQGIALGTPAYLSPEQASGEEEIDGRADIYSLGCVLYEALSGSPPFSGDSVRAMLVHQMVDTPPSLRSLNEGISPGAEAIVDTAIRKEPDRRFQTGEQMAQALDLASRPGGLPDLVLRRMGVPQRHADRVRPFIAAASVLLAIAILFGLRGWLNRDDGPPSAEVRYVVLEHEWDDATQWESQQTRVATETLREQLNGWNTVSVVRGPALEGPTVEFRAAGLAQGSLALGLSLAERFDADYRLYVAASEPVVINPAASEEVERVITVTAWVYHPTEQVQLDEHSARGSADDLAAITAEIALYLLEIEGGPLDYPSLLARSSDHVAHQEFQDGRDALWQWRLAEAERLLSSAIARDDSFALAHHLLAETMYWQMARDEERMRELGPKIESHSRKADQFGVGDRLRPGERKAVNAFRAFWTGDYDLARGRYDSLLAFEQYDFESLLLRGAVEVEDPLSVAHEDGVVRPRQNLNVARAQFDTATALNPSWELSWGHLHRIDRQIARTAYLGTCPGFEPPTDELVTPYEIREAVEQLYFCPVVEADTIRWVNSERTDPPGDSASVAAAAALHRRTTDLLAQWTLIERDQPRHHEELAAFLLWEQYLPGCDAEPVRTDSLRAEARRHIERALEIRGDTTPQDRLALASHYLGDGDLGSAMAESDRALDEMSGWESAGNAPPAPFAANTYLAAGQAHPAIDILERVWRENTMGVVDPQDPTRTIDSRGMYSTIMTLRALGTLGESGPDVAERFDRLRRAWADASLSNRDRAALRAATLSSIEPALVHSRDEWEAWFGDWSEYGFDVPAVWRGIFAAWGSPANLEEARGHLEEAIRDLEEGTDPLEFDPTVRPIDLYMPLLLAERIGATDIAQQLRRRFGRCALRLDGYDAGWGALGSLGLIE